MKKIFSLLVFIGLLNLASAQNPQIQLLVNQVNADSIWSKIATLTSMERYCSSPDTVCRHWLSDYFTQLGFDAVSYHYFSSGKMPNVVAERTGELYPDSIIVVGAHYDSYTWGAPGADDNASGTAGIMEVARILAAQHFQKTIRFVCFSAEEIGLVGSYAYAQSVVNAGEKIFAMINLDMISHAQSALEPPDFYVSWNSNSQQLLQHMENALQTYVPQSDWNDGSGSPYASASDHASFWAMGIPAIFLNDCLDLGSPNFNSHIHSSDDVIGISTNHKPLAQAITQVTLALLAGQAGLMGSSEIHENRVAENIRIAPNPATQYTILYAGTGLKNIRLYNQQAQPVSIRTSGNGERVVLNTAGLAPGLYFIQLEDDAGVIYSKRLIIK